ncbi:MAG TPA: hypothetical protein DDY43_02255 [Synechococcales bacterium UBA10510]|nr:hypothetical protein [Synechococcales bacterium UBA10510]
MIIGGLEAATYPLVDFWPGKQLLLVNGGDFLVISPGLAGLGSLVVVILGCCCGVNWQLASCHLLTSDP